MSDIKLKLENSGVKELDILKYADQVAEIHHKMQKNADNKDEFMG